MHLITHRCFKVPERHVCERNIPNIALDQADRNQTEISLCSTSSVSSLNQWVHAKNITREHYIGKEGLQAAS